ncbi:MAG: hypothetical protein RJB45_895 [Pseudomonadota bacterium]|jgi:hypothetical protein
MTIALFGISSLYNSIQNFMSASSLLQASPAKHAVRASFNPSQSVRQKPESSSVFAATACSSGLTPQRALRVMRIAEQGDAPSCAGRMVISGRMADVCAELDRLVALEAQKKSSLPH